jgi:hypothetical protein
MLSIVRWEDITAGIIDERLRALCAVCWLTFVVLLIVDWRRQDIYDNFSLMSVSRLCCPVCRAFFEILKDKKMVCNPMIRGSHSNLFPVQLPTWTPLKIRKKMEEQFLGYLRDELVEMMNPPPLTPLPLLTRGSHRHSMSESAVSSSSSHVGQPPEFYSQKVKLRHCG